MAQLQRLNKATLTEASDIEAVLQPLGVRLASWPVNPEMSALLEQPVLTDEEKEQLLRGHDARFEQLRHTLGYQTRDLVVLHPDVPGLDGMLAKFDRCHYHTDDEVRYIIAGEGVFGFVLSDGDQAELLLSEGEYINIPARTEHWFHLTERKSIKAIRYFTSTAGWVPEYTETPIMFG